MDSQNKPDIEKLSGLIEEHKACIAFLQSLLSFVENMKQVVIKKTMIDNLTAVLYSRERDIFTLCFYYEENHYQVSVYSEVNRLYKEDLISAINRDICFHEFHQKSWTWTCNKFYR